MKQPRILLLTDSSYYTISYDFKSKKIDYSHCKHHSLQDFVLVDIGPVKNHKNDEEVKYWGFNIFTNEKSNRRHIPQVREEEDEEEVIFFFKKKLNISNRLKKLMKKRVKIILLVMKKKMKRQLK